MWVIINISSKPRQMRTLSSFSWLSPASLIDKLSACEVELGEGLSWLDARKSILAAVRISS